MPSNNLALGLYKLSISKRTFLLTTGFCRFREGERRRLSIGDNFLQQLRRSGVSRVCGEKVAAVRTEKLGTHSHTGRLLACDGEGNEKHKVRTLAALLDGLVACIVDF